MELNNLSSIAIQAAVGGKQDAIKDLDVIRAGAAAGATAVQLKDLATVASKVLVTKNGEGTYPILASSIGPDSIVSGSTTVDAIIDSSTCTITPSTGTIASAVCKTDSLQLKNEDGSEYIQFGIQIVHTW